jgi:hypothetical protein
MNLVLPKFANPSSHLSGLRKLGQRAFAISLTLVTAFANVSNEPVWANPDERLFNDQDLPSEMEAKSFRQRVPDKDIYRERYVRVNMNLLKEPDVLKGKAFNTKVPFVGSVKLNLFVGTEYNVVLNSAQRVLGGSVMFLGYIEGLPESRVALFADSTSMSGTVWTGSGPVHDKYHFFNGADSYRITCSQDSSCIVSQEKPTPLGHDDIEEDPVPLPSVPN